jgi:uncharacterized NAD-dependent epimerase/dehydratase family protein
MSNDKPGFTAILINASALVELGIPFAVAIHVDEIKAYLVTKDNWNRVEKALTKGVVYYTGGRALISYTDDFSTAMREMGWIKAGEV